MIAEVTWLVGLFNDLDVPLTQPIKVISDSRLAIQLDANLVFHERTKHIEIDCHFIRDKIKYGLVQTQRRNQDYNWGVQYPKKT